jgi:hypothetical protein
MYVSSQSLVVSALLLVASLALDRQPPQHQGGPSVYSPYEANNDNDLSLRQLRHDLLTTATAYDNKNIILPVKFIITTYQAQPGVIRGFVYASSGRRLDRGSEQQQRWRHLLELLLSQ